MFVITCLIHYWYYQTDQFIQPHFVKRVFFCFLNYSTDINKFIQILKTIVHVDYEIIQEKKHAKPNKINHGNKIRLTEFL